MVTKWLNRKEHSLPAIFVIYSIFSNRNQITLSSSKVYYKLFTMTAKKVWVPVLVGELYPFPNWQSSISRQIHRVFNMRTHEGALNDTINYAQKGCAVQMWGMTLKHLWKFSEHPWISSDMLDHLGGGGGFSYIWVVNNIIMFWGKGWGF